MQRIRRLAKTKEYGRLSLAEEKPDFRVIELYGLILEVAESELNRNRGAMMGRNCLKNQQ